MSEEPWDEVKLGSLCTFRAGGAFPTESQGAPSGDLPFIKVSDFSLPGNEREIRSANNWVSLETAHRLKAKPVPAGSVVFAKIGEALKSERIRTTVRPTLIDNNLMAAIPASGLDSRYAPYLFVTVRLAHWAAGTALPYLRQNDLAQIPVILPPIVEQHRIAGVLGALDDLLDTNERLATTFAELRRQLIESATATAVAELPLSSMARFVNGRNFTKDASGSGRPIIRTPEARSGVNASTLRSEANATRDNVASAGDILLVWSGSLLISRWSGTESLINQHIFKVIPNGCPDWLVYGLLQRQLPWFLSLAADKATTMGHIQRAHLDAPVPIPAEFEIARLERLVRPLWDSELALAVERAQLRTTRDELLPLLMSRRIRVAEAEEMVG